MIENSCFVALFYIAKLVNFTIITNKIQEYVCLNNAKEHGAYEGLST